jgi:4'-phosphopantetheinyl transferase
MLDQANSSTVVRFIEPVLKVWNPGNDIHIWKFPAIKVNSPFLTSSENNIASRFRLEDDRNRFTVGRHALRLLLSEYLSVGPSEISISSEIGKKPFVSNPSSEIHFNMSHSGNWILIAFAKNELGIDIEKIDFDFAFQDILPEHFSEAEQVFIAAAADPLAAFYYMWTRKEALTKAWGTGLQENLKQVTVLEAGPLIENGQKSWTLASFCVSEFYPAAIAFIGKLENIIYFDGNALII